MIQILRSHAIASAFPSWIHQLRYHIRRKMAKINLLSLFLALSFMALAVSAKKPRRPLRQSQPTAACPLYERCSRFPDVSDEPCSGTNATDPCPGGRAACHTDPNDAGTVYSCCCIKYDPKYKHLVSGSPKPPPVPGKLRLYFMRFCPYSHRIMMTSVAKNVSTDIVYLNLKNKAEWFSTNLGGKVPITETDDGWINESLIEADYLDDQYSQFNPLYPTDSMFQKAYDRQLIDNYNKFIPGLLFDILYGKGYANVSEVPAMMKSFEDYITKLGNELTTRGSQFFGGGAAPGMMDYMIYPWMERREVFPMFYPNSYNYSSNSPRMAIWLRAMQQDNAVSTWRVAPEVHFQFAMSSRAGSPDYDMLAGI